MTSRGALSRSPVAEVAAGAPSWDALATAARACTACRELAATRTKVVPGQRPAGAEVLLLGEAPGAAEDVAGVPFVGRAGAVLDQLLAEAALPRSSVAVANVLKCRPPGNRTPRRGEVENCRPWLERQLELADPVLVVTLGGTALAWALGAGTRISAVRGEARPWRGRTLLATYHPSAALRFGPGGEPMAALRADLALAARLVGAAPGSRAVSP